MRAPNKEKLDTFRKKHPKIASAIDRWVNIVEAADWKTPCDVKKTFGVNVDFVGKQVVFDIGGNKARIIAKIVYGILQIVNVTHVLDHSEYNKKKVEGVRYEQGTETNFRRGKVSEGFQDLC